MILYIYIHMLEAGVTLLEVLSLLELLTQATEMRRVKLSLLTPIKV